MIDYNNSRRKYYFFVFSFSDQHFSIFFKLIFMQNEERENRKRFTYLLRKFFFYYDYLLYIVTELMSSHANCTQRLIESIDLALPEQPANSDETKRCRFMSCRAIHLVLPLNRQRFFQFEIVNYK